MVSLLGNGLRKLGPPEACILFINGLQLEKPFREFRTTIPAGKVRAGLVFVRPLNWMVPGSLS